MSTERLIVVDLEGTCWDPAEHPAMAAQQAQETEVIEIGAVRCSVATGEPLTEEVFRGVVRPRRHPRLSGFCRELTGLTQAEVDAAPPFVEVMARFRAWAGGDAGLVFASWGAWDHRQLRRDCRRHEVQEPAWTPFNIKRLFSRRARAHKAPRGGWMSLSSALQWLELSFEGQPHRAVDDAVNAARLLAWAYADLARAAAAASPSRAELKPPP